MFDPALAIKAVRENAKFLADGDPDFYEACMRACENYETGRETSELPLLLQLARYPVGMEEFMFSPEYLGKKRSEIYPEVLKELIKINNPRGTRIVNEYVEGVFTGGIGSAKSTSALYTVAYQLYVLSCFRSPHDMLKLDDASEILFVFQSISGGVADNDYQRFYTMITTSPYFQNVFPYDRRIKSRLKFPNKIEVKPIGADHGTIGQNVIGGLIDELNFMAVIQNSRKAGDSGVYDQAQTVYNSIARRRKSRFQTAGKSPGILCLVSSKRYPGEFTDKKIEEAKSDPTIYIYDKRVWDVKPKGTYVLGFFKLFIGDMVRKARIMDPGEKIEPQDAHLVMDVPNDYLKEFKDDMMGALRDVAGVSVLARYPFFSNTDAVTRAFGKRKSILNLEETDMETTQIEFYPKRFTNKDQPRWVHIDLGVTSDSAGVVCGHVPKFVQTSEGLYMPQIDIDFALRVKPPRNEEIKFYKLRQLLVKLRDSGLPIQWITFDSFQSVDMIQILRTMGFSTGKVSMDVSMLPYQMTKTALNDERVNIPASDRCRLELLSLEMMAKEKKIDHPPNGSKDVSDALAGVIHGLTTRREIWALHGIPINQDISLIKEVKTKEEKHDTVAA
jgi:hypothetical protein